MKVHLPIVGKASGSSAGLIYQSYWGNTYTRSFPFSFHYPDTDKQQKCQFDFYRIQRAWWTVYDKLKTYIPKSQRRNRNIFNKLSAGVYSAFLTYGIKAEENIRPHWGIDPRNTVLPFIEVGKISYSNLTYNIDATLQRIAGKRRFNPTYNHFLLCNITQQEMYYKIEPYTDSKISTSIFVTSEWLNTDIIIAYVAFSNDEFFTNFYLCNQ